jgi:hypothetical protein
LEKNVSSYYLGKETLGFRVQADLFNYIYSSESSPKLQGLFPKDFISINIHIDLKMD